MTDDELGNLLREARPREGEIAPLDAVRSAQIRAEAIASVRRRNGGTPASFGLFPAWRPVAAAAFVLLIGAMVIWKPGSSTRPLPVAHVTPVVTPMLVEATPAAPPEHEENRTHAASSEPHRSNGHAPARRVRHRSHPHPPATVTPRSELESEWATAKPAAKLPVAAPASEEVTAPIDRDPDGPMVVAATGVPDDDSGELHVSVRQDVSDSVPGVAEASSVRSFEAGEGKLEQVAYWANARVASDTQPTLTLTALR